MNTPQAKASVRFAVSARPRAEPSATQLAAAAATTAMSTTFTFQRAQNSGNTRPPMMLPVQ